MNRASVFTKKRSKEARAAKTSGFGRAVLASLRGRERGERLTVRQVADIPQPRARRAQQVKRLRTTTLGVSQTVFARLIGVSPKLVEAWESGRNSPAGPVCRLFELIERDPRSFFDAMRKVQRDRDEPAALYRRRDGSLDPVTC